MTKHNNNGNDNTMKHPPRNIDQSCFDWQKIILKKTDLPYQSKYLALYLATYMNLNRDFAYPGLKAIERETGMSHATVLRYMDLLVSEGWIGKQSGSSGATNTYWITFPEGVGQEVTYVSTATGVGRELTSNNNIITSKPSRGTQIGDDFEVTSEMVRWVQDNNLGHIDIMSETDKFIDYNKGKGNVGKDWKATWRNWIRNANKYSKERAGKTSGRAAISAAIRGH